MFPPSAVREQFRALLDEHPVKSNPHHKKHQTHLKQFVQTFVDALCLAPDANLFTVISVALPYPDDVLEAACGRWRKSVMRRAIITEDVMQSLMPTLKVIKIPAPARDYAAFPSALRFFAYAVRLLVDDIRSFDGSLPSLLDKAQEHPVLVQEMACTRWRSVVCKQAFITQTVMEQWATMVRIQVMANDASYDANEYERCADKCAEIVMDTLERIPDVEQFEGLLLHTFPPDASFAVLVSHRAHFFRRFPFLAPSPKMWQETVRLWAAAISAKYRSLDNKLADAEHLRSFGKRISSTKTSPTKKTKHLRAAVAGAKSAVELSRLLFTMPERQLRLVTANPVSKAKKKKVAAWKSAMSALIPTALARRLTLLSRSFGAKFVLRRAGPKMLRYIRSNTAGKARFAWLLKKA